MRPVIGAALVATVALLAAPLIATEASAQIPPPPRMEPKMPKIQIPPRQNVVRPNRQNLMEGPSYWTNEQRRLNIPNADANPTQRENNPFNRAVPAPLPPAPRKPGS